MKWLMLLAFLVAPVGAQAQELDEECGSLLEETKELRRAADAYDTNARFALDDVEKCSNYMAFVDVQERRRDIFEKCDETAEAIGLDGIIRSTEHLMTFVCN